MDRFFRSLFLLAPAMLLTACASEAPPASPETVTTRVLEADSPAPPAARVPRLFADTERLYLSWMEPGTDEPPTHALRFSSRALDGGSWTEPRTIVRDSELLVNWADFPSLVALADGTLAAHWLKMAGPRGYDYEIRLSLSADGGEQWAPSFRLHRDDVAAEHGFVSMVPTANGSVTAVWLDGRETVVAEDSPDSERGAMTLRSTVIAPDGTRSEERLLDARICDCCQTDAARSGDRIVAVYRDRSDDEIRDIYAVTLADGDWSEPVRVAEDGWRIPGCPVNGPAITALGEKFAVAWFTLVDEEPQVRLALGDGRAFDEPRIIDHGGDRGPPLGRVDLAAIDDHLLLTWLVDTGDGAEIRFALFDASGRELDRGVAGTTSPARSSGFPRMAAGGDRAWLAWRVPGEPGGLELRTIVIDNER